MENELITTALNTLKAELPIDWKWEAVDDIEHKGIDGALLFLIKNQELNFQVVIKNDLKNHQLYNVLELKESTDNILLVTEKLYPKMKAELRENQVSYLEANGNVYLENDQVFLFIDNKRAIKTKKEKGNRAFTKTGLKVVFHFLLDPKIINWTQREIAEISNVALGNIPQVINGLRETNFLLKKNKNEFIIGDYKELLNKWVGEYEQTLKPTLFKQRFMLMDINRNWKQLHLNPEKTVWGGEPGGDLLTNHLRPEAFTLYTKETNHDLMRNYRMVPNLDGDIWVYEAFWNTKYNLTSAAPAVLIYTDLMLKQDKRCIETANIIFNEYIQPNV